MKSLVRLVFVGLIGLDACGQGPGAGQRPAAASTGDADAPASVCGDAVAAGVLAAEDQARLDAAMTVRGRLHDDDAVALAEKTITDRSLAMSQLRGELRAAGLDARGGPDAEAVADTAGLLVQALATRSGGDLDRSYAEHEAVALVEELGVIERVVAPSVRDGRLAWVVARAQSLVEQDAAAAKLVAAKLAAAGCDP